MEIVNEQETQNVWDEVAAERNGKPVKHVEKPAIAPAAKVPDEVKPDPFADFSAKFSEFENKMSGRLRNVEGHIGNLTGSQKQMRELLDASKSAAQQAGNAPSSRDIKQAIESPSEWNALKNEFPEWATATEKLLDSRIQQNPSFDAKAFESQIRQLVKGETDAVRETIIDSALDAVLPNWKEEVNTAEFNNWQNAQPDNIRALADSDKVGDAAKMFKLYEKSRESNSVNQIVEQRKNTLAQATATPKGIRTTSTQKSYEDMTPAEKWAYEKKAAKRS